jgi:hypothetical protein
MAQRWKGRNDFEAYSRELSSPLRAVLDFQVRSRLGRHPPRPREMRGDNRGRCEIAMPLSVQSRPKGDPISRPALSAAWLTASLSIALARKLRQSLRCSNPSYAEMGAAIKPGHANT